MTIRNSLMGGIAACAVLALQAAPSFAGGAPVFKKLMDTSFVAPDGQTIFTIDRPQMLGDTVAYIGATGTPHVYLFTASASKGNPTVLVSDSDKVPGGTGTFTGSQYGYFTAFEPPNCASPMVSAKGVVFIGRDAAGNQGIYLAPTNGKKIVKLVDYATSIPGAPVSGYTNFNGAYSFCNFAVSGSTVIFDAGRSGVYEVDTAGKSVTRVADANTPATINTFEVNQYLEPTISGKNIAYVGATVFGPYAIFDGSPDVGHALVIATRDSFDSLAYPILAGKEIDFSAHLTFPNQGIFTAAVGKGKPTKIMDYATQLPAGTPGTSFSAIGSTSDGENWSPDGKLHVVAAQTTDGTNLYAGLFSSCKSNQLTKVLTQGDTLDGVTDIFPGAGVSTLMAQKDGSALGAILVGGFRYAAIYTVDVPGC